MHVLWSILDKRREDSGRALMLVPPTGEGGRGWLVRTPQSLLKKEFVDGILDKGDTRQGPRRSRERRPRHRELRCPRSTAETCAEGGAQ